MATRLWLQGSPQDWYTALAHYPAAVKAASEGAKRARFAELDQWHSAQLPAAIRSRTPPHLTKDDMVQLVEWKLLRGKSRPRLLQYAQSAASGTVEDASTRALSNLGSTMHEAGDAPCIVEACVLQSAVQALVELKGVGPATASAALCCVCPAAPFMSDEALTAAAAGSAAVLQPLKSTGAKAKKPLEYTLKAYMVLAAELQAVAHALQAVQAPQSAAQAPQSAPPGPSPKTIHQQPLSSTSTQHLDTQLVLTHGSEPHAGAVAARAAHAVHITWSAVLVERALWAAEVTVNRGLHASAPTKTLEKSKVEQPPAKQQAALKGLVSGKGRAMATSAETSAAVGVEGETGVRSSKRARE